MFTSSRRLLYLQCDDPRIKARVLKYLRCEDLTPHDRRLLGGIVPCTYPDAPHWVIQRLGQVIWAVERVPLILCVDQLEDVFDLDEAAVKFRKAMATLCDLVSRLPSAIVVISCLENFYDELKKLLTRPIKDRVENDPRPVSLQTPCDRNEVERPDRPTAQTSLRDRAMPRTTRPSRRSRCPTSWCAGWSGCAPATSCSSAISIASAASRKGRWPTTLLRATATRGTQRHRDEQADQRDRASLERRSPEPPGSGPRRGSRAGRDSGCRHPQRRGRAGNRADLRSRDGRAVRAGRDPCRR